MQRQKRVAVNWRELVVECQTKPVLAHAHSVASTDRALSIEAEFTPGKLTRELAVVAAIVVVLSICFVPLFPLFILTATVVMGYAYARTVRPGYVRIADGLVEIAYALDETRRIDGRRRVTTERIQDLRLHMVEKPNSWRNAEIRISRNGERGSVLLLRSRHAEAVRRVFDELARWIEQSDALPAPVKPKGRRKRSKTEWERFVRRMTLPGLRTARHEGRLELSWQAVGIGTFVFLLALAPILVWLSRSVLLHNHMYPEKLWHWVVYVLHTLLWTMPAFVGIEGVIFAFVGLFRTSRISFDANARTLTASLARGFRRETFSFPLESVRAHISTSLSVFGGKSRTVLFLRHEGEEDWMPVMRAKHKEDLAPLVAALDAMLDEPAENRIHTMPEIAWPEPEAAGAAAPGLVAEGPKPLG